MEENNFLRAYREYLKLYLRYLDENPRIERIYISNGRRLELEDSDAGIYQFNISESEFLRLDKMMSGEVKVLITGQEYEHEILSFDEASIVIRLRDIRDERIERVCLAGDAKFLRSITEKQIAILENPGESQKAMNLLSGNFEGAERFSCSFRDRRVERNQKQKEAVEFSVGVKDLFLIWGPPGTGKTTVVPEIIRNYLVRKSNAKILVCSYANRAVDRIVEIICADENLRQKIVRVGPSQIGEEYRGVTLREIVRNELQRINNEIRNLRGELEELKKKKRKLVNDEKERIKEEARNRISALEEKIRTSGEKIESRKNRKNDIKNERAQIRDAITRLRDEESRILDEQIAPIRREIEEKRIILNLVDIYLGFAESRFSSWSQRRRFRRNPYYISHRDIIERFNLGDMSSNELRELKKRLIGSMIDIERSLNTIQASLRNVRGEINGRMDRKEDKIRELKEIEKEIETEEKKKSESEDEKAKLEVLLGTTRKIFLNLARKVNIIAGERIDWLKESFEGINAEERIKRQGIELLERTSDVGTPERQILNRKQIIATTNLKLLTSIFDDLYFDLAIMDEAGFTDLPAALGPFVKADKLILIGDHKQLEPIIQKKGDFENHVNQYPFIEKSIFEQFWERRRSENQGIMLNEQHRMIEEIASFISEEFYDNELRTGLNEIGSTVSAVEDPVISSECPLVFINVRAWENRDGNKSPFCPGEIEVIKKIIDNFGENNGEQIYDEIGVISPFRAQSNRIKDRIPKEVACGTVHVFQGHEKTVIIYSTVRQDEGSGSRSPLLSDVSGERLLNVAVSRGMRKFILVGNMNVLSQIPLYRDFLEHMEQYGKVYNEILEAYNYPIRCEWCGRPLRIRRWRFCEDCYEAMQYERDSGGLIQLSDGMIVRTRGEMSAGDGHWVRSEGERQIDIWFQEHKIDGHSINHRYEMDVEKYLFSMDERFERDLSEGTISGRLRLRRIFRRNGVLLSGDAVVARTREEDEREISDYENNETYSIEKKGEKLKVYKKSRIPMWCDWYLPDYEIYVEYWGLMEDIRYEKRKEKKEEEYERLQLKLLSIKREDLDNLDEKLREKFQDFDMVVD